MDETHHDGVLQIDITLRSLYWPNVSTQWQHRLTLFIPQQPNLDLGVFYIQGGINRPLSGIVKKRDTLPYLKQAQLLNSVIILLNDVPNQYLSIAHSQPMKEDDLMAYGWLKLITTNQSYWSPHYPMAKAGHIALDTAVNILQKKSLAPNGYILSGLSKRGWASWLLMLKDERIHALMPTVINTLDLANTLPHIKKSLGDWPEAFTPYKKKGITDFVGTSKFNQVIAHEDPWYFYKQGYYKNRFSIPILNLTSAGDDFFVPDANNNLIRQFSATNLTRVLPNEAHHIKLADYLNVMNDFYYLLTTSTLPHIDWQITNDQIHQVTSNAKPNKVILWHAQNTQRDFRYRSGIHYESSTLSPSCNKKSTTFTVKLETFPDNKHYHAHFVEWHFPKGIVTTPVYIFPDQYGQLK